MMNAQVIDFNTAPCPYCGRTVRIDRGRFRTHSITPGTWGDTCPMQREYVPISGNGPDAYEQRAQLVAHLAWRMKDEDPAAIWRYLTVLSADELQRLLMISLAAVPVDRSIDELFSWVNDLPAAQIERAV